MDSNTIICHSLVVRAQALVAEIDAMRCENIARNTQRLPMAYDKNQFHAIAQQLHEISAELRERAG